MFYNVYIDLHISIVLGVQPSDSVIYLCVCVCVLFFRFFSLIGYYKILSIVPQVIQ